MIQRCSACATCNPHLLVLSLSRNVRDATEAFSQTHLSPCLVKVNYPLLICKCLQYLQCVCLNSLFPALLS